MAKPANGRVLESWERWDDWNFGRVERAVP